MTNDANNNGSNSPADWVYWLEKFAQDQPNSRQKLKEWERWRKELLKQNEYVSNSQEGQSLKKEDPRRIPINLDRIEELQEVSNYFDSVRRACADANKKSHLRKEELEKQIRAQQHEAGWEEGLESDQKEGPAPDNEGSLETDRSSHEFDWKGIKQPNRDDAEKDIKSYKKISDLTFELEQTERDIALKESFVEINAKNLHDALEAVANDLAPINPNLGALLSDFEKTRDELFLQTETFLAREARRAEEWDGPKGAAARLLGQPPMDDLELRKIDTNVRQLSTAVNEYRETLFQALRAAVNVRINKSLPPPPKKSGWSFGRILSSAASTLKKSLQTTDDALRKTHNIDDAKTSAHYGSRDGNVIKVAGGNVYVEPHGEHSIREKMKSPSAGEKKDLIKVESKLFDPPPAKGDQVRVTIIPPVAAKAENQVIPVVTATSQGVLVGMAEEITDKQLASKPSAAKEAEPTQTGAAISAPAGTSLEMIGDPSKKYWQTLPKPVADQLLANIYKENQNAKRVVFLPLQTMESISQRRSHDFSRLFTVNTNHENPERSEVLVVAYRKNEQPDSLVKVFRLNAKQAIAMGYKIGGERLSEDSKPLTEVVQHADNSPSASVMSEIGRPKGRRR